MFPFGSGLLKTLIKKKMNQFLQIFIVAVGISSAYAYMDEKDFGEKLLPLTKQWHDKCIFVTETTQASIDAVKNGNFDDNDDAMKRYILCLWLASDQMTIKDNRLNLNQKSLKELIPAKILNGSDLFMNCAKKADKSATDPKEKTWALAKCTHDADPENFIMF
ncbi:hypothetical protein JTB14_032374 [Gonioctena quinquepunctata]|nr:hypothetical protein JTB14_032374 [Gonioctena quinquepunctata]